MERDPEQVETRYVREFAELSGTQVLEIGCGEGRLIWRYADATKGVVGVDTDPARLAAALQDRPAALQSRVRLLLARAEALPFPDAGFDRVILGWSL